MAADQRTAGGVEEKPLMASVIYLRGRNWRLRQGDDGKGRDLSKRIHSSWKTGGTEEKLADLNTYRISPHETKSVRPGPYVARYWCVTPVVVYAVCVLRLCVHSTEVDVRWPGQQRLPSVPGLGHLPGGPHHLLSGIHPDSGSAGCRYDKTRNKKTPAERDTIHRAFKKRAPDSADKDARTVSAALWHRIRC